MRIDRALLIWVPSRRGSGAAKSFPVGLLYAGRILEDKGVEVAIYDVYRHAFGPGGRGTCEDDICRAISGFRPQMVGFGGIATSYGWCKILSRRIRRDFPDITQIAGGALSSTYELLLGNTAVDTVFHGEAEVSLPEFVDRLRAGSAAEGTPGTSRLKDGKILRNPPAEQVKDLDSIPFPAYHLVDMRDYFSPEGPGFSEKFLSNHRVSLKRQGLYDVISAKLDGVRDLFPVVTARGCTHRCSFCYRHMEKYRKHSVDYVIRHIKYVQENFGAKGIGFYDELFNGDTRWVLDFCDALEESGLDIAYKTSARADRVDPEMLRRMSATGCFNIEYGQESGSDRILKEYMKGVTRRQNLDSYRMTLEAGIFSVIQLVIGSPGENKSTLLETADFLREARADNFSLNYLLPFPGAPVWRHVEEKGLIPEVEEYLDLVAVKGGGPIVNLTSMSDKEWKSSADLIRYRAGGWRMTGKPDILGRARNLMRYSVKRVLPGRAVGMIREALRRAG